MSPEDACEVCGRTLLVGEKVHSYVSVEGRHEVCDLCVDRVAEAGWLPADEDGAEERMRAESERKPGFLSKLFTRPERDADEQDERPPEPAPPEAKPARKRGRLGGLFAATPGGDPADLPAPDVVPEPELSTPPPAPAPPADASPAPLPDPAGRGMRPRRLQPDLTPTTRFERALARFNSSDAGRTAAGLTRTLGAPSVSVGDLAGAEEIVRVTVAWELTWYQWGIDLGDELRPVFELEKGFEIPEIDAAARQWNASAHDGRIVMVAPRREAESGRPVHR
ncbi:MAG: hypothetical protein JST53_08510 [Actinobacteria bacterium]|nr:hypothetical protein [Actinomycetota bacterium]